MLSAKSFLMFLMFIVGGMAAFQAAFNAQLSGHINNPIQASFISFCVGAFTLGLLLIGNQQGVPSPSSFRQMPVYYLLGGMCGAIFITCVIYMIPRIGVVNVLFLSFAGQVIVSTAIDRFGLFGVKPQLFGVPKIVGMLLIVVGVACIQFGKQSVNHSKPEELDLKKSDENAEVPPSQFVSRMHRKTSRSEHTHICHTNNFRSLRYLLNKKTERRQRKSVAYNLSVRKPFAR